VRPQLYETDVIMAGIWCTEYLPRHLHPCCCRDGWHRCLLVL